ncbi:MAG TPA: hypothetical protein PKA28_14970 [Methylomusa anaerophila]|uniref:Lipoprotein chaperone n=1 Tax=Methylomusa anaerophila TaxID=1930071 RepID=A0A348AJL4_9FIRM|nr:hypothetical protein [Methylomusa anaerophila]BBB91262.1 hypothetical protein MAMMFC1_01933 [Methylomusa anaerophila]HML89743.1 hypothetical protein [Methylomusa anaerophila]
MKALLKGLIVVLLTTILLGCQKASSPVISGPEHAVNDVTAYFPSESNMIWVYQGEGNEFAGFTRRVMIRQGNRVQFSEDNGGTKMMMVFQVSAGEVKRTFFVPEFYTDKNMLNEPDNLAEVILKAPLKSGAVWQDARNRREVLGISEKITVPAGTFENVVKIKVTPLQGGPQGSQLLEYYAPNTGLILREFTAGDNFKVLSKLDNFKP